MFSWIRKSISLKITFSLVVVLALLASLFTAIVVQQRGQVLKEQMQTKARTFALVGARAVEQILEEALASGRFTRAEIFDTDYRRITEGPLARAQVEKYHTAYDAYLDARLPTIIDSLLEEDPGVVFAIPVDRNGYLPTHNRRYAQPLTGDPQRDLQANRTKQMFNDPVGLRAARYDGGDGQGVLHQVYERDTGEVLWDISVPIYVGGNHWGAFRLGFSIDETQQQVAKLRNQISFLMLGLLVVAALAIYFLVRHLTQPLKALTRSAERISQGHAQELIPIRSQDEIGSLAEAFNHMTQVILHNLQGEIERSGRLIHNVKEAVLQLSSASNEIMAITSQQSSGASQQAAAVHQATSTAEEFAATARQVAENAKRVEGLAEDAVKAGHRGKAAVDDAGEGMDLLRDQVQQIAEAMLELGENSQKIGGIVDLIDEISDQTNLLALNAAIEAAGAGEAGRRFSIVAGEVKRLADRTADATRQINGLIEQIQKSTNATIVQTEEGTKKLDNANRRVARIAESLDKIIAGIDETTTAARDIKVSTQHQFSASEQMTETISEVRDVASQVATSAEETAHSVAELNELAERLKQLVEEP
ncbi:Methyl-accepting chemotaxis protein [Geoalkalibacter ferrihydriticus]|uniref:Chemotaxis protein n=2 Tax=Geoalkalibacter ferrihydriticus TaxID=392333 RepID=A0A0C2HYE2_9BACT|nr:methyl-accepting chemotaxis protein [Geoalkalibacter ferrihydriticus]KIH77767.1 chemotaxis protein [Geoalkalibacter ferrihydriticus DSM 17813]SDL77915.1 Methyl-accepting chemotaxis protein [Geoalkalibacter ferrihydriticus]